MKIATKSERRWRERSFGRWTKQILWNSVHYKQSYKRSCWPTLSRQCAFGVCQCIWVRATWLWCRGNFPPFYLPLNFPQSDLGRRADSRSVLPQISSCFYSFTCVLWTFLPEINLIDWLIEKGPSFLSFIIHSNNDQFTWQFNQLQ